jgi:carboxyl-terminal processing protease
VRTAILRQLRNGTALLGLAWIVLVLPLGAAEFHRAGDELQRHAQAAERRGDWLAACRWYQEALRKDGDQAEVRSAYQRCLRRHQIVRRHRDTSYREMLTRLSPGQALEVYEQVLATIAAVYVDRGKVQMNTLFHEGVQELRYALDETLFLQEYFAAVSPEILTAFRNRLGDWEDRKVPTGREAREQVLAVVRAGQQVGLPSEQGVVTVIVLEFAAGACNALDEYTLFLTPGSYGEAHAASRGRMVGVGMDLAVVDQRVEVARVYPRGPARDAGILRHDRVVSINRQDVDKLPPDAVAEMLRGEPGTTVRLELLSPGQAEPRVVELVRRAVTAPSVDSWLEMVMDRDGSEMVPVGFLRISSFGDNTVQEVKEALASLQTDGMKVLILDLRGNPGGLFKSALQVAALFLGEGVVVITQGQHTDYDNKSHRVNAPNPVAVPMVVLIDSDTASAAEILAGALKEHRRATLVGQTTFGKGTIQCLIPLTKTGGIRITVARIYSPASQAYNGVGVSPDVPLTTEGDPVVTEARKLLLGMLKAMPSMTPMGMPR